MFIEITIWFTAGIESTVTSVLQAKRNILLAGDSHIILEGPEVYQELSTSQEQELSSQSNDL